MKTKTRSVEQIVNEQVKKWRLSVADSQRETPPKAMVTVSREPGSGGKLVAAQVAAALGLDLFHQEVIHEMAQSAKVSAQLAQTLDERRLTTLENWIASLVDDRHLWPDQYLRHLMKVIGTIGKHGGAVIVGRGANFILAPEGRMRVRVVAPRALRIENVCREYGVAADDAQRRIIRTESDRRAFIRKYFNADIDDPLNYDLIINTGTVSLQTAADAVCAALGEK